MNKDIKHGKRVKIEKKIRFYFGKESYVSAIEIRDLSIKSAKELIRNLGIYVVNITRITETKTEKR